MKGCLLLQRRFAYIGHYMAKNLKEEYGVDEFCGYVYLRSSYDFLKKQTDIRYTALLLDEEIHERYKAEKVDPVYLDYLEKEFGLPNLWPYLTVDRLLMFNQLVREYPYNQPPFTHEEMLRILQVHAKAILKMFEDEKPDFLFCSVVGGIGSTMTWYIAKKLGIKTYIVLPTCIRNRYIISEDPCTFTSIDSKFNTLNIDASPAKSDAMEFLEAFRSEPVPYFEKTTPTHQPVSRKQQLKFLNPAKAMDSLTTFLKGFKRHLSSPEKKDYSYISPWNYLRDMAKRKVRNLIGNSDLYEPFDPKGDFAFFPLHYEPEAALLLQAPFYTDQIGLIRQIARSLPVRFKLVVKEHPAMAEFRPRSFYKKLKKIPNVRLINPGISGFSITPYAKLVTTITGSTGWEAVLLKKPVISFGHQFYNSLSMVTHCHEIEGLPRLIHQKLEHHIHDDRELLGYLTAIFEDSSVFELHQLWLEENSESKKMTGVVPLADLLAKKLELI
ncbi:MAG: hypothetical protein ABIB04_05350 [Patescibacteria group bacterium]